MRQIATGSGIMPKGFAAFARTAPKLIHTQGNFIMPVHIIWQRLPSAKNFTCGKDGRIYRRGTVADHAIWEIRRQHE